MKAFLCEKVKTECLNKALPKAPHNYQPPPTLIRYSLIEFCKVYPFRPLLHSNMQSLVPGRFILKGN